MPRKPSHRKKGIIIRIPGFGVREIHTLICDYTGTLSFDGELVDGVKERLIQLSKLLDIHVVSADATATAKKHLGNLPLTLHIIKSKQQDADKRRYLDSFAPEHVIVLGNGINDRLLLQAIKENLGLAICVDNGEGCAIDALMNSHLLIHGAVHALDLLLHTDRILATLHF
jgi:soluble P-type ATPase